MRTTAWRTARAQGRRRRRRLNRQGARGGMRRGPEEGDRPSGWNVGGVARPHLTPGRDRDDGTVMQGGTRERDGGGLLARTAWSHLLPEGRPFWLAAMLYLGYPGEHPLLLGSRGAPLCGFRERVARRAAGARMGSGAAEGGRQPLTPRWDEGRIPGRQTADLGPSQIRDGCVCMRHVTCSGCLVSVLVSACASASAKPDRHLREVECLFACRCRGRGSMDSRSGNRWSTGNWARIGSGGGLSSTENAERKT